MPASGLLLVSGSWFSFGQLANKAFFHPGCCCRVLEVLAPLEVMAKISQPGRDSALLITRNKWACHSLGMSKSLMVLVCIVHLYICGFCC